MNKYKYNHRFEQIYCVDVIYYSKQTISFIRRSYNELKDFISCIACRDEKLFKRKIRFLQQGQYNQKFDLNNHINHWQRFMYSRQNLNHKNKFWLINYATQLDMRLFDSDTQNTSNYLVLPISIHSTIIIESLINQLKIGYLFEHEINQMKGLQKLLREDTLTAMKLCSFEDQRFYKNIAKHELNQLGHICEMLSKQIIYTHASKIQLKK